jgi:hypothetical protein
VEKGSEMVAVPGAERTPINASHTWWEPDLYLLADEDLVARCENLVRRLCPVEKSPEPILVPDRPWEGLSPDGEVESLQDPFYATILFDPAEEIFRCWYRPLNRFLSGCFQPPHANQESKLCYAISRDGIHWEKPALHQVLFQGSGDNNMLRLADESYRGAANAAESLGTVVPYSESGADFRFAATIHSRYEDPIYPRGITVCFSRDGIGWQMHFPPILPLHGDCHTMGRDPRENCFLLTTRCHQHQNLCRRWGRPWKRPIALAKSRDLFHWTPPVTVLEADDEDPDDTQLYMMHIVPYGHAYLGQLLMFSTHEMVLDNQLALSRDLIDWQRLGDRRPFLERGAEGSWDSKHVSLSKNPPHPEGDQLRFWYGGKSTPHYQAGYGALGTATLRRDGFVCYQAGEKEGVLTTIPLWVGRTTLALNVDATRGEARVEIVDQNGNPIDGCSREDCYPVRGNHVRALVQLKAEPDQYFSRGNLFRLREMVRFRFYLRNARLYAFKAPGITPLWPEHGSRR